MGTVDADSTDGVLVMVAPERVQIVTGSQLSVIKLRVSASAFYCPP